MMFKFKKSGSAQEALNEVRSAKTSLKNAQSLLEKGMLFYNIEDQLDFLNELEETFVKAISSKRPKGKKEYEVTVFVRSKSWNTSTSIVFKVMASSEDDIEKNIVKYYKKNIKKAIDDDAYGLDHHDLKRMGENAFYRGLNEIKKINKKRRIHLEEIIEVTI